MDGFLKSLLNTIVELKKLDVIELTEGEQVDRRRYLEASLADLCVHNERDIIRYAMDSFKKSLAK